MCIYVHLVPLCGHNPSLLFGPSCYAFFDQLNAITEPAAWEPPGLYDLPFKLPDSCLPNSSNIAVVQSTDFCDTCKHITFQHSLQQHQYVLASEPGSHEGMHGNILGYWPGVPRGVDPVRAAGLYDPEPERVGVGWRS